MYFSATVTGLTHRLRLVSLRKDQISSALHTLIQVFFFDREENSFLSYTETNDEITLILPDSATRKFPPGLVSFSDACWRAIQFTEGSTPTDCRRGFVNDIATPLGRAGIPIYFLTTFNSDLVLVEESNYENAKLCLKANLPILWADEDPSAASKLVHYSMAPHSHCNMLPSHFRTLQAFPDMLIHFTCMKGEQLRCSSLDLLQLLFYGGEGRGRFVSFTVSDDEVSLLLDATSLSHVAEKNLEIVLEEEWVPIKRCQKAGFTETGVVSALASPLGSMSMYYMSSFQTGWFMVKRQEYEKAVEMLKIAGFHVTS